MISFKNENMVTIYFYFINVFLISTIAISFELTSTNNFINNMTILNLRSNNYYNNYVNKYCPNELNDNYAGRNGLYFNTTDKNIKKSIIKKYFHHCGAWCLFDTNDPRKGWYWNSTFRHWDYYDELYKICPSEEFYYVLDKFFKEKHLI